jgi:hypothetical protein
MARSTFAVIHAKINATGANENGPYNAQAARQIHKLLAEHGWTEEEYVNECEKHQGEDEGDESES